MEWFIFLLASVSAGLGIIQSFALNRKNTQEKDPPVQTIMGKFLTPEMFSRVKKKCTSKAWYGIDQLIECGLNYDTITNKNGTTAEHLVENWTRLLAGDEECYDLFGDLIDPFICVVHNVDQINSLRSEINLNWKEIQGGKFYGGRLGALLWTEHYS